MLRTLQAGFVVSVALMGTLWRPAVAQAQGLDRAAPQVIVGVRMAEVSFQETSTLGIDWRAGFAGGVDFTLPTLQNKMVSVHPEALFVQNGVHLTFTSGTSSVDESIRVNYLEGVAALDLNVLPVVRGQHIVLEVGPTFSGALSASSKSNDGKADVIDEVHRFDAGFMVGGVVPILERIKIGVRYEQSFTDAYKGNDAKNRSLTIFVMAHIIKD
jgi:hypothetical protein